MPIEIAEDILQNNDFSLATDNSGDLVLEHKQTGGQFKFDQSENAWFPVDGLTLGGADINNIGNIDTDSVDVADNLTAGSATVNGTVDTEALEAVTTSTDGISIGVETKGTVTNPSYGTWIENTNSHQIELFVELTASTTSDFRVNLFMSDDQAIQTERIVDGVSQNVSPTANNDAQIVLKTVVSPGDYFLIDDQQDNEATLNRVITREWSA